MQTLYVETPQALDALAESLRGSPWLALDTEFIREKTFRPQLCLIQVSNGTVSACVDPLAIADLTPLLDLIYDPAITKVMHAGHQDLEIFLGLRGELPRPVFDTQLAATVLGYGDQVGYGALVRQVLGVELDKAHTRTDWMQRPLDPEQLEYAADDVVQLGPLYLRLLEQLEAKGRRDWLDEDFAALTDPRTYCTPPDEAWLRIKGAGKLKGMQLAALRALTGWREAQAIAQDKPRRWILKDEILVELARQLPDSLGKLGRVRGLEAGIATRHGATLVELIAGAKRLPAAEWPVLDLAERLSASEEAVVDLLTGLVRQLGADQGVSPAAIAGRRDLEQLVLGNTDLPLLHGWRGVLVGHTLRAVVAGEATVRVCKGRLLLEAATQAP
ncbi:MAG: ribonuclease D [Gammaproteobacteria bacterium]|nr:ribonuclease D [Gammaproteobacteria bacterium]